MEEDLYRDLPRFELSLVEEVPVNVAGAETMLIVESGYWFFDGWFGADGFQHEAGLDYGLVKGNMLSWFTFEQTGSVLENMQSATGLGIGRNQDVCESCFFVTDGPAAAVKLYINGEVYEKELSLPDTELEGIASAASGTLYVVDAKARRVFRLSADLSAIEAVAPLPGSVTGRVPTGLAFDDQGRLHVCFRDADRIAILAVVE